MTDQEIKDLIRIRNYFEENSKTVFDHVSFEVLNKIITKAQEEVFISGELNIKPLSVNEAYTGRRYKTDQCRQYSKSVGWLLKQAVIPQVKYEIRITWFFSSEASDVDNPAKIFIDQLQKKYRFNDKQVYKLVLEKRIVNQGQEKIKYEIKEYRD